MFFQTVLLVMYIPNLYYLFIVKRNCHFLFHPKTKFWYKKHQLCCMRRKQNNVSGLYFFYILFVDIHTELTLPPSTCVHLSLTPPLTPFVVVINGWSLKFNCSFWSYSIQCL